MNPRFASNLLCSLCLLHAWEQIIHTENKHSLNVDRTEEIRIYPRVDVQTGKSMSKPSVFLYDVDEIANRLMHLGDCSLGQTVVAVRPDG